MRSITEFVTRVCVGVARFCLSAFVSVAVVDERFLGDLLGCFLAEDDEEEEGFLGMMNSINKTTSVRRTQRLCK
jgi:hypothetical protein